MWKPIYLYSQIAQRLWISVCVFRFSIVHITSKPKANNNFHPLLVVAEHFSSHRSFTAHIRKKRNKVRVRERER